MSGTAELTGWLAHRSVDQLTEIVHRRPDSTWGAPLRGLDDLASRLSQPSSVMAMISRLPLPAVELLQALAALGPRPTVAAAADLLAKGDRSPSEQLAAVHATLADLEAGALAWRGDSALGTADQPIGVNPGVRVVLDEPLGLGRTVAAHLAHTPVEQLRVLAHSLGLPDTSRRSELCDTLTDVLTDRLWVSELLATAPNSARRRLALLTAGEGAGPIAHDLDDREGENWARQRGLLFGGHYYPAEVPVEVHLAVRSGEIAVRFDPEPPPLPTVVVTTPAVSAGAAAAAAELTETVAALVDSMSRSPLPELKSGGVGTREVARTAKSLGLAETTVRFGLELIRALGLLAGVGSGVGVGEPAVGWRADEPSARYADLAVAWWGLPITPTLTHDPEGKAIPAIGGRSVDGSAIDLRWTVLRTIDALPADRGLAGDGALAEHLNWHRPGQITAGDPAITAIWVEAHALGILVQGAVSPIGTALLRGDPEQLLTVAETLLPPATSAGRFGSDLTVMVAGSPTAAVSKLLDSCADRESRGAAIVWRFSPASVRRAMDEGATADELLTRLAAIGETALPQTLTYLIGDVARRHGSLVVQPAASVVRSDDQALLIEVTAHRSLRSLQPLLVAPTVIVFQAEPAAVLSALRAAGYLPVPAGADGVVTLNRGSDADGTDGADGTDVDPPVRMVQDLRHLRSPSGVGASGDPDAGAAVRELAVALLSAAVSDGPMTDVVDVDREPTVAYAMVQAYGGQLDEVQRRQLAYAIDHQVPVTITYQSSTGGTTSRTISDIELVNGLMYAWCHLRDDERVFAIDRVQSVAPVPA